jgi:hypothetical protein
VPVLETLKGNKEYELHATRHQMTRTDKDYLFAHLQGSVYSRTGLSLQGWRFPFNDVLNTYLVKLKYSENNWKEVYAPDRTSIRNYFKGNLLKIAEIK